MGPRKYEAHQSEMRSIITSTIGGVMTEEVGAVTGELEIATHPRARGIEVTVRYAGADEWYTVEGSPIEPDNDNGLSPPKLRKLHERVVRHLTTPGPIVEGNEQPVSLLGFSPIPGNA